MRKIKGLLLLVMVLGIGSGCRKSDETVAEELMTLMEGLASIAEEQKGDCDAMGEQLGALVSSHKDLIEASKKIKRDPARAKVLRENYGERVQAAGKKMLSGLAQCGSHPKVRAAIKPTLIN